MVPAFKYEAELTQLPSCPPASFKPRDCSRAFRFVYDPLTDPRNFLPKPLRHPPRNAGMMGVPSCSEWALSFFDSEASAQERFDGMRRKFPQIATTLGTHLAAGSVSAGDGVVSSPGKGGHFELHEYATAHLTPRFTVLRAL